MPNTEMRSGIWLARAGSYFKGGQKIIKKPAAVSAAVLAGIGRATAAPAKLFAIVFIAELSLLPGRKHLGPVNGILVKKVCHAAGKLIELKACVALQIGFRAWFVDAGQQAHNAPGKRFALESPGVGQVRQACLHGLRKKCIGEGEGAVCANAQAAGPAAETATAACPGSAPRSPRAQGGWQAAGHDSGKPVGQ